jgi:hypothetical protein
MVALGVLVLRHIIQPALGPVDRGLQVLMVHLDTVAYSDLALVVVVVDFMLPPEG